MLDLVQFSASLRLCDPRVVTISTEGRPKTNAMRDGVGAFLSDPDRVFQRDLEIQEYTDRCSHSLSGLFE